MSGSHLGLCYLQTRTPTRLSLPHDGWMCGQGLLSHQNIQNNNKKMAGEMTVKQLDTWEEKNKIKHSRAQQNKIQNKLTKWVIRCSGSWLNITFNPRGTTEGLDENEKAEH